MELYVSMTVLEMFSWHLHCSRTSFSLEMKTLLSLNGTILNWRIHLDILWHFHLFRLERICWKFISVIIIGSFCFCYFCLFWLILCQNYMTISGKKMLKTSVVSHSSCLSVVSMEKCRHGRKEKERENNFVPPSSLHVFSTWPIVLHLCLCRPHPADNSSPCWSRCKTASNRTWSRVQNPWISKLKQAVHSSPLDFPSELGRADINICQQISNRH